MSSTEWRNEPLEFPTVIDPKASEQADYYGVWAICRRVVNRRMPFPTYEEAFIAYVPDGELLSISHVDLDVVEYEQLKRLIEHLPQTDTRQFDALADMAADVKDELGIELRGDDHPNHQKYEIQGVFQ